MDVVQVPVLVGAEFGAAQAQAMLLEDTRETEAANERKVKARLKVEDIAWNWRNGVGDMAPLLIEASNLVDVLVLNTALPSGSGPDMRWIISSVVTESGKPEIGRAHVELQSLMRISYAVFCLKKKTKEKNNT